MDNNYETMVPFQEHEREVRDFLLKQETIGLGVIRIKR
jgi:hypothetical protein